MMYLYFYTNNIYNLLSYENNISYVVVYQIITIVSIGLLKIVTLKYFDFWQ